MSSTSRTLILWLAHFLSVSKSSELTCESALEVSAPLRYASLLICTSILHFWSSDSRKAKKRGSLLSGDTAISAAAAAAKSGSTNFSIRMSAALTRPERLRLTTVFSLAASNSIKEPVQ